jgi:hypothetical protein
VQAQKDTSNRETGIYSMLHSINELNGYKLQALDSEIGKVSEFYFDDKNRIIRYLAS